MAVVFLLLFLQYISILLLFRQIFDKVCAGLRCKVARITYIWRMYDVTFDTYENTSATEASYSISISHMEGVHCNSPGGVCVLAGCLVFFCALLV